MGKKAFNASVNIDGLSGVVASLEAAKPGDTESWQVGSDVEYSVYVEFGTKNQQAQPYLRPAVNQAFRRSDKLAAEANSTDEFIELLAKQIAKNARETVPVDTGRLKRSIKAEKL